MSNGCVFRADRLTAASRVLPIGAWVRVTSRRNRRSVVVEITDRGPYVAGRVLDLSRAAAERLDMVAAGIVLVSIERMEIKSVRGCV
jgi:rare lipoprotein A